MFKKKKKIFMKIQLIYFLEFYNLKKNLKLEFKI
jgi:hypothetical protein